MAITLKPALALLATAALLAAPAAFAAEAAKPAKVAICAACHQETGVSKDGQYPNLAGQYANYLEHSLKAYRSGERKNAIMSAQAKDLTDGEIKELARWYATQAPSVYTPAPQPEGAHK